MKKQQLKSAISAAILGVASPLAMVLPASAATATWAGHHPVSGYDGMWSTSSNWESLTKPANGDTAVFPVSGNVHSIENDESALSLAKLVFSGTKSGSSSKSYEITGNAVTVTEAVEAVMGGAGGDHQVKTDFTLGGDVTLKTTGSNTLTVGDTGKVLDLGANDLTLDASGGTIVLAGKLKGSGNLVKSGAGKVKLMTTPDAAGYTGGLTLGSGELSVEDALGLNVTVSGGTLKGTGTVGTVSMSSGSIAPGNSPGVINTGNLTLTGGTFEVELGGTADGEYDQTNVTGTVNLGTATTLDLTLFGGFEPEVNDVFTIINNDGTDAVTGTFSGLANGGKVTLGDYTYQVNYDAGDGNDVRVLVTGTPSAPDTGIGSIISNPLFTIVAAVAALGVIGGLKYADTKIK